MPRLSFAALACVLLPAIVHAQAQFQAPRAKVQTAPERTFDLKHLVVKLDVDYPNRSFSGVSTNTFAPLRAGLKELRMNAGAKLTISSVKVNGQVATYARQESDLVVTVPATAIGKNIVVETAYKSEKQSGAGFGGGEGGWHWINPNAQDANRIGFWTQGETLYNRNWAPTWDYPNDFTTSETYTTVPKDWTVVGNGSLVGELVAGERKTVHWKMTQPHATYLLSLCGGPFDVKKDRWENRDLWYVVPRGYGNLIDDSFGDTKDMLTFYSQRFGVKYAWPKYAQNAMYDFGGGMENVSATTLGMGSLTDKRSGFYTMSSLNAHELGHQWFGDLVTCKDWGHTWLNESWATFAQELYFEHARGAADYDRQVDGSMMGYFGEARRYKRPIATNFYEHPDNMFDSHSYPKGAAVLHTFRRFLGDNAFFAGVKRYLTTYGYGPVESADFCRALTEASGIDMTPMFEQWVYKPGHPVLEYSWEFDPVSKSLRVKVDQKQATDTGTPTYNIGTKVLVIANGKTSSYPIKIDAETNSISIPVNVSPDAVILDPNHDFLREMRHAFGALELAAIAEFAPNANDRAAALSQYLGANVNEGKLKFAERLLAADKGMFPVFESTNRIVDAKSEAMREFFRGELSHKSESRRRDAVRGLANLGLVAEDKSKMLAMLNDQEMYSVVLAIVAVMDPVADKGALLKAAKIPSRNDRIKKAAEGRLSGS